MKTAIAVGKPKPLHIRTADIKHMGDEPNWRFQPESSNRVSKLGRAFNWYNYYANKKMAKEFVTFWLASHGDKNAKALRSVPDQDFPTTLGWLCRMNTMGLELDEHELMYVKNSVAGLLAKHQPAKRLSAKAQAQAEQQAESARITIQDRLRKKVLECAGDIEGMFDDFVKAGAKMSADYKPITLMRSMNIAPQMVHIILQDWKTRLDEFEEVLRGKDPQLVEGYQRFTKNQIKNFVKFTQQVIADCDNYVQIKKVERKPRTKKAVSPEKLTRRFKFLKEFAELKLVSESPTNLVGASEAWLYDTKKRKLIHVVADSHAGSITVKSSSIIGMNTVESQQKTLRRPAEQLRALLAGGKPAQRKYFKDIRATSIKFKGRGNNNLIILKAW